MCSNICQFLECNLLFKKISWCWLSGQVTVFRIQVDSNTIRQCQEKRKENEKRKDHPCPSLQFCKSSWKHMKSIVHRLRHLCVQPSEETWKLASTMNRFSRRWVNGLLSSFFSEMNWLGLTPRNMGPQSSQAQNWWRHPHLHSCLNKAQRLALTKSLLCCHFYFATPTTKTTHPSPFPVLPTGPPFLIPLYIRNGQSAPPRTLHLESPAQKHHFRHHFAGPRSPASGSPFPPRSKCFLSLTAYVSVSSGQTRITTSPILLGVRSAST